MQPIVAVGGIAVDVQSRVLLIQRGKEPARGLWTIPGGKVELGETLVQACCRELTEETGLDVRVIRHVDTLDRIDHDDAGNIRFHFVLVDYLVEVISGQLRAASDAVAARWLHVHELETLPLTDGLMPILKRAITLARKPG